MVTPPATVVRGDVWLAALDPTVGSEIQKTRPCVIVSPPEMHDFLRTVTVAPMTTGSHPAPYRIPVRFRRKNGLILLDQIRTLDKVRLVRRLGVVMPVRYARRSSHCARCSRNRSGRSFKVVVVVHTFPAGDDVEWVHIISMRPADAGERRRYEQASNP